MEKQGQLFQLKDSAGCRSGYEKGEKNSHTSNPDPAWGNVGKREENG